MQGLMYRPNVNEFELIQFRGNNFRTDFVLQDQVSDWGSRLNSKAPKSNTMFFYLYCWEGFLNWF